MRAHTQTYVTDFAALVDERTEDMEAEIFTSSEVFQKISAVAAFVSGLRLDRRLRMCYNHTAYSTLR